MKVGQIMLKPFSINESELATKARTIIHQKHLRMLSVVDRNNNLVGVISRKSIMKLTSSRSDLLAKDISEEPELTLGVETDILEAGKQLVKSNNRDSPVLKGKVLIGFLDGNTIIRTFLDRGRMCDKKISDIMSKNVLYAESDEHLERVWDKLQMHASLPVVKKGNVIGVITRGDAISSGKFRFSRESERGTRPTTTVQRVMKTPAITANSSDDVDVVARTLVEKDIGAIPIVDKKLVGIATRYDFLKAFVR